MSSYDDGASEGYEDREGIEMNDRPSDGARARGVDANAIGDDRIDRQAEREIARRRVGERGSYIENDPIAQSADGLRAGRHPCVKASVCVLDPFLHVPDGDTLFAFFCRLKAYAGGRGGMASMLGPCHRVDDSDDKRRGLRSAMKTPQTPKGDDVTSEGVESEEGARSDADGIAAAQDIIDHQETPKGDDAACEGVEGEEGVRSDADGLAAEDIIDHQDVFERHRQRHSPSHENRAGSEDEDAARGGDAADEDEALAGRRDE
jgi:hypothetical protein